jgi:hypothetical protein
MIKAWSFVVLVVLAAMSASLAAQQGDGNKIALLIGNANYPDADAPLRQPVQDARALGDELRRNGFDVEVGENLTKEGMQRAFDRLYEKIRSGTSVVLFFGGFGTQMGRQTYLIPVNAQIWREADVQRDGTGIDTILAELNARGANVKIAILDASRRNPFDRRIRGVSTGLAPVTVPKSTLVISAAAPGTVVNDGDGDNSVFVQELLKEMRSQGLTAEEIFNRTRIGVSRVTKGEQVPWISSSLGEDFYFGKPPRPADSNPPLPKETKQEPPARDPDADIRRDFDFAERLGTRQGWQDFLAKYKTGAYAELARDKLARLEPQETTPPPTKQEPEKPKTVTPSKSTETTACASTEPQIVELDRAIEHNPDDSDAYFKRGLARAQKACYGEAIKDFDQVIRLNPKDFEAFNNRCWARAVMGELQVALKDCNASLRLKPNFVDALDSRGLVNLKIGLPNSAIADYNAALRVNPKHASALYGRGKARLRNGDTAGGNADLAAAKAIDPDIAREFEDYGVK